MRVLWVKPEELVELEFKQAEEEGRSVDEFMETWNRYKNTTSDLSLLREKAEDLLSDMAAEEVINVHEPTDYHGIVKQTPQKKTNLGWQGDEAKLYDKILGGWLGRSAGCLLGKPVEGRPREWIRTLLESTESWPLDNYFTAQGVPEDVFQEYSWHNSYQGALRESIVCMPEDDDLNYPMVNLAVAETFGPKFRPADVLQTWLEKLPVLQVFTAERVAYFNALKQFTPQRRLCFKPVSGMDWGLRFGLIFGMDCTSGSAAVG